MKILVLNDYFGSTAGGFVVAYNLALECRKRGHEIAFLTTVQSREEQGMAHHEGMPVYKIYTRYPLRFRGLFTIWNPFVFKRFSRAVQEICPDIIHAHIIHMYLSHYVLKIAHNLHVPSILTAHDAMTFCYMRLRESCSPHGTAQHKAQFFECLRCQRFRYVPFRNAFLRHYVNRYVSNVISVSNALKAGLEINGIHHVQTIYNGIFPEEYAISEKQATQFRKKYDLDGKKVLLFAGRSSPSKGLEKLVRAMPQILKARKDTRLLILSSRSGHHEYVCNLAKELGVYSSFVFPGWLEKQDMKVAYAACDICVVPSIQFEPLATVILEAMASKKAVVGTAVGGIPEIIVDGETGYIVHPQDISGLAEKILYLFQHQDVATRFGEEGYKRIQEKFHIRHQCDRILAVYAQAIAQKTR